MTNSMNNKLYVELHVPDFSLAIEFYGRLGFKKVQHHSENSNPDYLVMERHGTILNFWPGNEKVYDQAYFKQFPNDTKRGYAVELVVPVEDVRAFHDNIKDFAKVVSPLVKRPWGLWDFRIEDPFGYYLRITEDHDVLDPNYGTINGEVGAS